MRELASRFLRLSEELGAIIETEGWLVLPYKAKSLPYFCALSESRARQVVQQISDYIRICQVMKSSGHSLKNNQLFVRTALQLQSLVICEGVHDLIQDHHIVEFYDLNHLQMFRTFNFFERSSYTLEDIYCRPWFTLYDRDVGLTEKFIEILNPILVKAKFGKDSDCDPSFLPFVEHFFMERASLQRLRIYVRAQWIAPLFANLENASNQGAVGFVNVLDAEVI